MTLVENNRAMVLGYYVDLVNIEQAKSKVAESIEKKQMMHVVTLNPEMIISAQKNHDLSQSLLSADLAIPDGVGIQLALSIKGIKIDKTVPGIELSYKVLQYCAENNHKVAFLGAQEDVLQLMKTNLLDKIPELHIIYAHNGFFDDEKEREIVDKLVALKPALLLVALGVPRQEIWINKNKQLFNQTVMIGVGGSFDVWSGKVKRAPALFRSLKLEWLYRITKEPFRIKRIIFALPYFVFQVLFYKHKPETNQANI